jgi:hypothetical protein
MRQPDRPDLAILLGAWTTPTDPCPTCCVADLDGDGAVGPVDLALLLGAWGTACDPCDLLASGQIESESNVAAQSSAGDGLAEALLSYFGVGSLLDLGELIDGMSPAEREQAAVTIELFLSSGGAQ